jgi:hypothetical protein
MAGVLQASGAYSSVPQNMRATRETSWRSGRRSRRPGDPRRDLALAVGHLGLGQLCRRMMQRR